MFDCCLAMNDVATFIIRLLWIILWYRCSGGGWIWPRWVCFLVHIRPMSRHASASSHVYDCKTTVELMHSDGLLVFSMGENAITYQWRTYLNWLCLAAAAAVPKLPCSVWLQQPTKFNLFVVGIFNCIGWEGIHKRMCASYDWFITLPVYWEVTVISFVLLLASDIYLSNKFRHRKASIFSVWVPVIRDTISMIHAPQKPPKNDDVDQCYYRFCYF